MIGSLSLDQLRVLVTIADTGSFSAAGRRLGRAQSAISQSVAALEGVQGIALFDRSGHRPRLTEIGGVLVRQARLALASAAQFEEVAANARTGLEPELALAIDPLVPTAPLIASLRALSQEWPALPVSFSTEGLGGAERKLRDGSAALALCLLLPSVPDDIAAVPLLELKITAVVAPSHPLADIGRPATRADLEPYIQFVLSDPVAPGGPSYGIAGTRLWRFVDLSRRLDFVLAGLGWCRMPDHLIRDHLTAGRLKPLAIEHDAGARTHGPVIHAARTRDRALGRAGRWLLDDLTARVSA